VSTFVPRYGKCMFTIQQEGISLFDLSSCSPTLNDDDHCVDSKRRCRLFPKRSSSKRSRTSTKEVAVMRQQIDDLHVMITASSLETSERLRQRLALTSRYYYEGVIATPQQPRVVEAKTESNRRRAEMDSMRVILEHEKRVTVRSLETQLTAT